jgi:hypothetical protein
MVAYTQDLGKTGRIVINTFEGTNTYLKIYLGLIQVDKFTRIRAEV